MSPARIENFGHNQIIIDRGRTTLETDVGEDLNIIATTDGLGLELYMRGGEIGVFDGVIFRGNVFTTRKQGSEIRAGQTVAIVGDDGSVRVLTSIEDGFLIRPINSKEIKGYLPEQKLVTRAGVTVTGTLGGWRNSILNG